MKIELFGVSDGHRMAQALAIRISVFVVEQGVPPDEEVDAHDHDDIGAVHALARDAGGAEALGTGRLYSLADGTARIGRMAVLAPARGRGVGAALLAALMEEGRRRGFARVQLDAQVGAIAFYARAGFEGFGAQFWEAGLLHQRMGRAL